MEKLSEKINMNVKIWQWKAMEYVAYVAVSITPLYFGGGHWFPYNAPKAILISLFAFVMLIIFGLGLLSKKRGELSFSITPVHVVLFIFLVILTISSLMGVDPHNSFFGVWSQSISLVLLFSASIFALLVGFLVRRDKSIAIRLLTVSFVTSVIISFFSYFGQKLFPLSGVGSTLGNTSFAGAYLLFAVCFGIGLFFWSQKYWQKILIALGVFIIVFCPLFFNQKIFSGVVSLGDALRNSLLFMGESNGALVGLIVSVLVIISLFIMRNSKKKIQIVGLTMLVLILGGIFYTGMTLLNPESKLHKTFVEEKGEDRFLYWDIARSGLKEHPLLGNGFNNYTYTFQSNFKTEFYKLGYNIETWTNQPHNIIWEYLSTTGLFGLLSFLALLATIFLAMFLEGREGNKNDFIKIMIAGILVGYFVQNLFVYDSVVSYFVLFLVIGVTLGLLKKEKLILTLNKENINKIVSTIIILGGFTGIILFVVLPWKESKRWQFATNKGTLEIGLGDLQGLQGISPLGGVADSAFLVDSFFNKYQKDIIETINITKSFETLVNVENFLDKEIAKQPLNFRSHLVVARVMIMHLFLEKKENSDLWKRAHDHLDKAHILNPQNPDIYFLKAQLFSQISDFSNAYKNLRAGIILAPIYGQGYVIADELLKISPDKNFQNYIKIMKNKWIPK